MMIGIVDNIFGNAALYTFGLQFLGFLVAFALQTETFYDVLGGINFLLLALVGWTSSSSDGNGNDDGSTTTTTTIQLHSLLFWATLLHCISRGWLLVFLAWRAHSRKGDARFEEVIHKPILFLIYWMVQAFWVYLISFPLLVLQQQQQNDKNDNDNNNTDISTRDIVLLIGWFVLGIVLEISSDVQKTLWIQAERRGGFCRVGWWKYSRHPNYAGEIMQWWFAAALCFPNAWGLLSPLFTMVILLLLSGTGISHAEGKNQKRYYESPFAEEYKIYRENTSPLIPLVGYGKIPLFIKRTFLFEWERYEYRPTNNTKQA